MAADKTPSAPALDRALSILEGVASSRAGLTISDLVRRLALPKSSAHCLLVTLERRGYLIRNPRTGRFMFGLKLFDVANRALAAVRLRQQAAPFLQALVAQTGLVVHMGILEQSEILLVEKLGPPALLRSDPTWVGRRLDSHCTGMGKALIAYLSDDKFDQLFRGHLLPRYNENTITSAAKLREHLAQIRTLGYAFEDEEGEIGFRCIGAPIFDRNGKVVAAISVAGTTAQIATDRISMLGEAVKNMAHCISLSLSFQPNQPLVFSNDSDAGATKP